MDRTPAPAGSVHTVEPLRDRADVQEAEQHRPQPVCSTPARARSDRQERGADSVGRSRHGRVSRAARPQDVPTREPALVGNPPGRAQQSVAAKAVSGRCRRREPRPLWQAELSY